MQIFLIRHAHAVDAADDLLRPLSRRGRDQVRALARWLKPSGIFAPVAIWHSPLARAAETAALLRRRLGLRARLVKVAALEAGAGVEVLAKRLARTRRSLALVGHEPHLSALASRLVAGVAAPPVFVLKKGAILALERAGPGWAVRWQVAPELLERGAGKGSSKL